VRESTTFQPANTDFREIKLTRGMIAIVDAEDYERVSLYTWHAHKGKNGNFYARGIMTGVRNSKQIYMHRLIMNVESKHLIDHKDRNGLNNRKTNLRTCSTTMNAGNKLCSNITGYKGVGVMPSYQRKKIYKASIRFNDKQKTLGYYLTAKEAGQAYDKAAKELFGEFALLNFPDDEREGSPVFEVVKGEV
jgi:hypothetical protein